MKKTVTLLTLVIMSSLFGIVEAQDMSKYGETEEHQTDAVFTVPSIFKYELLDGMDISVLKDKMEEKRRNPKPKWAKEHKYIKYAPY